MNQTSYPLSPLQSGMLFHALSAPQSGVDIEQILCTLHEPFQPDLWRKAWQTVIARHDILRTSFAWQGLDEPRQIVAPQATLPIITHDWQKNTPAEQEKKLADLRRQDRQKGFDLTAVPLMRLTLIKLAPEKHHCLWTFHHILLDGRSFPLVLTEVFNTYDAQRHGREFTPDTPRPYRDYIHWLQERDLSADQTYWHNTLQGFRAPTPLPTTTIKDSTLVATASGIQEHALDPTLTRDLESFAKSNNLTLNTLIQGAWSLLLHHYSGDEDIVFGATRACRHSALDGAHDMIGLFINTLPMRVSISPTRPLLDWLQDLRQQQIDLRQHEHTPLTKVQAWSDVPTHASLFDSLVVFENYLLNTRLRAQGGDWLNREFIYQGQTNYPLTLMVYADESLLLKLEYDPSRFTQATISRMLGHLETLLTSMMRQPHQPAISLPYLTAEEEHQLRVTWNDTAEPYPADQCVHELIAAQASRTPHAIAAVCGDDQLTYQQLNQRANQLAHYLQRQGVQPDTLVGICLNRSLDMLVGLLGIWKAGGAYVPLDPDYPNQRLAYMLEDAQVNILLTESALLDDLPTTTATLISLDTDWHKMAAQPVALPRPANPPQPHNLAYVIYTSGSTGKPKGVQVPHQTVNNFLTTMSRKPGLTAVDRLLAVTTLSFDIAVLELYLPLIMGATTIIAPREVVMDGAKLVHSLDQYDITIMQATPSTWRMMLDAGWSGTENFKALCGGEALPHDLAVQLQQNATEAWNMYGPTETTVWSTCFQLTNPEAPVLIGRPIGNTSCYILDKQEQLVPVGTYGELYIGGDGVVRGYLNRPELTAVRFIPDPFSDKPHARLYRTGDLVRYLEDGQIEYLNRIDNQVKVRGFRIELGEIENTLSTHPQILRNAVTVKPSPQGDKQLVAYIVTTDDHDIPTEELKNHLGESLPPYMIPSHIMRLSELPLTNNGKIDRKALPDPTSDRPTLSVAYIAPQTTTEKTIADIWCEVLQLDTAGIHDNFFDLGGNSLQVLPVIGRIGKAFDVDLSVAKLFEHPTIHTLAQFITDSHEDNMAAEIDSRAARRQAALRRRQATRF